MKITKLLKAISLAGVIVLSACNGEATGAAKYKADLEKMKYKFSPGFFVKAASKNDVKAVDLFIKAAISVDATNKQGNTALAMAANKGHAEIVKLLLDAGANPSLKGGRGLSAIVDAISLNHTPVVQVIVDHLKGQNNGKLNGGRFAGLMAAKQGFTPIMAILIDAGLDINTSDDTGYSLLITAIKSGHKNTVEYLLEKGADVNLGDKDKNSPLKWAKHSGYPKVAKVIKRYGGK